MSVVLDKRPHIQRQNSTHESETLYNLAIGKINRNNFRGALDDLLQAIRIAPMNPWYLSHFALCLAHVEKDYARALRLARQAVEVCPMEPVYYVNLGKVQRLRGDNRSAYQAFSRAHQLDKKHPAAAAELARMGIRRPPLIRFLPRSHPANIALGKLRAVIQRRLLGRRR